MKINAAPENVLSPRSWRGKVFWWSAAFGTAGVLSYLSFAAVCWLRYGRCHSGKRNQLLDEFMPAYEAAEWHSVQVYATAEEAWAAALCCDLGQSRRVRAIFKARELLMGSKPDHKSVPGGLMPQMLSLGWGILAEVPGREIVVGCATRPWQADVIFRAIPSNEFEAFNEPDYAKIAWTIRVEGSDFGSSVVSTETRVATTDAAARAKFRLYWSFVSPGIALIRSVLLRSIKKEAARKSLHA